MREQFPPASPEFPQNVIDTIAPIFAKTEGINDVVLRDLFPNDMTDTLGIVVVDWEALDYEMTGIGSDEPTLAQHNYLLRFMVKDTDHERGRRHVNAMSATLRRMLAKDHDLRVALAALSHFDSSAERIERIHRWGVSRQRLADGMIDGNYVAASGTEFFVQTETIQGF